MKKEQKRNTEIRFTDIENITEYDTEDMQVLLGFDGITDPVLEDSIWEQVETICEKHSWNPERVCLYLCLRGGKTGIAFETRFDDMHFIEGIAQDWQKRLAGLTEANLQHVTGNINDSLLAIWEDYAGRLKKPTSTHWNHFLANHADSIYTRDQLIQLCRRYDASATPNPSRVDNLLAKGRFGSCFELFTFREIQAVAGRMQDVLKRFAGGEFAGKKQPSEIIKFDDF